MCLKCVSTGLFLFSEISSSVLKWLCFLSLTEKHLFMALRVLCATVQPASSRDYFLFSKSVVVACDFPSLFLLVQAHKLPYPQCVCHREKRVSLYLCFTLGRASLVSLKDRRFYMLSYVCVDSLCTFVHYSKQMGFK